MVWIEAEILTRVEVRIFCIPKMTRAAKTLFWRLYYKEALLFVRFIFVANTTLDLGVPLVISDAGS